MAEGNGGNCMDSPRNQAVLPNSRENMLDAAVRFLQNPLVQRTSVVNQETFLRSKGLTEEEVKLVLQRATAPGNKLSDDGQLNIPMPPPVPARDYNSLTYRSNGASKFREFMNTVLFVCGFTYGVYQFYKNYLHHLWFGEEGDERRNLKLDETCYSAIDELRINVRAINDTLRTLEEQQQRKQLSETYATAKQVDDLKAEIASVKSLLLGRNQFAPPVLQTMLVPPSIPSWQLMTDAEDMKGSEEEATQDCKDDAELEIRTSGSGSSENDMVTTNGSDSSLEMISKNTY
ncbi:peroxisomal membrane protein PEX14 isoform X2 [Anabrus simplex]|uniref:peroxisomal membrane protein PEX14 isoform X2 n=1 Tax=Anabrus simplex TaxID=316456 RepID=UPI0035A3694C